MASLRSRIIQRIMRDTRDALLGELPVEVRRRRIDSAARRAIRLPRGVCLKTVSANGVPADWLEPDNAVTGRAILYLHGGAYVICSPSTHRGLAGNIAENSQSRLLLTDYRLAPENPFPAALEDALAGYRWLLDQGFSPENIAIGGDSAGGGLSLATAFSLRDNKDKLPGALFLLSPWTDLTFSGESIRTRADRDPILRLSDDDWLVKVYANGHPLVHPYISPLFGDMHDLPPTFIQVGTEEILYDDSLRLEQKARAAGVDVTLEAWPGMWHVFQGFVPYVPESHKAILNIGEFIRAHI
jgi:monoterpene epsilon-lactone hydrolase